MIIAVTEWYHDYTPTSYFIDTLKLNPDDYIESLILKEVRKKSSTLNLLIDCSNWENQPEKFKNAEPNISKECKVKHKKGNAEKILHLRFDFDC